MRDQGVLGPLDARVGMGRGSPHPAGWLLIRPFAREHVPYTSSWMLDVVPASRHQVDMAMEDGLSCDLAIVDADVEPLYARVLPHDCLLLLLEEPVAGVEL